MRSEPERPARAIAAIATASDLAAGGGAVFGSDGRAVRLTGRAVDPSTARRLWDVSAALTRHAGSRPSRGR